MRPAAGLERSGRNFQDHLGDHCGYSGQTQRREGGEFVMRFFGRIKAEFESKGEARADADLLIAAIALDRELILAPGNLKHLAVVPCLRVEALTPA